jgi:cytochrome c5
MAFSNRRFLWPALGLWLAPIPALCLAVASPSAPQQARRPVASLHPGLQHLATQAYSPSIMDATVFANLWRSWDPASRDLAAAASAKVRRAMTLKRYGLLEAPFDNGGAPLGMVVTPDGGYAISCLVCHAGSIAGQTILGLPNNQLDFSAIYEDTEATIRSLHGNKPGNPPFPQGLLFMSEGKSAPHIDFPEGLLSASKGPINSFTFSVRFFSLRDKDLNVLEKPLDLSPLNNYLDPPPLWHSARKTRFYYDGFTEKTVRPLMQFSLDPSIGPALFTSWEVDYRDIYDWIHTIQSPKYAGSIDADAAAQGKQVYLGTCVGCHGIPGRGNPYPNRIVPIGVVQTDRTRLDALSPAFKSHLRASWFGRYGETDVNIAASQGYVAPPLDGIWASAPYLHNGSVPTLYHMLFPAERPAVWRVRDYDGYDHKRSGLVVDEYAQMPATRSLSERRAYYDTHQHSMSNKGHPFADALTREERLRLLEYLKSL